MMTLIIQILAFIFILGGAVVLHEFGHFIVAKLLGIRVETFSVGFGPRLWGMKWGTTDYRLSLVPLGGYVKLGGDESNAPIEGAGAADIPPEEQFNLRPRWQRIAVAVAGPVMNILTALTIPFIGALLFGIPVTPAPVVSQIRPDGAAQIAGLQRGDRIVSFNGAENPSWERIRGDALLSPGQPIPLVVERNGERVQLTLTPTKLVESGETIGLLDFLPDYGNLPVVLREVVPGTPAAEAGLKVGDRIVSIGGETVTSAEQVSQYIREHKGQPIKLTIERAGSRQEITTQTRMLSDGKERLGITPDEEMPYERVGPVSAIGYAFRSNLEILRLTGKALGQFFTGQRSARDTVSGPIGIARASSQAVTIGGWGGFLTKLAIQSLSHGVFNLLPIPVLDGGAIFLLLIEGALGWIGVKLSATVRERIQQVGFVLLLLLMGLVIFNDLNKEYSRWGSSSNQQQQQQQQPQQQPAASPAAGATQK
jgi:regulator of sigma E protease